jgi:uncharacterized protein YndB with AHSA1/START domain
MRVADAMTKNTTVVEAPPDKVWDVLADGWLYPLWVVGATRMRGVERHWPEKGAKIHHSAGAWPLVVNDETEVLECEPGRRLRLRAAGWPLGEAEVQIVLEPLAGGRTRVELDEDATIGPGRFVPKIVRAPVLRWRNTETLWRLARLAEGRAVE